MIAPVCWTSLGKFQESQESVQIQLTLIMATKIREPQTLKTYDQRWGCAKTSSIMVKNHLPAILSPYANSSQDLSASPVPWEGWCLVDRNLLPPSSLPIGFVSGLSELRALWFLYGVFHFSNCNSNHYLDLGHPNRRDSGYRLPHTQQQTSTLRRPNDAPS